VKISLKKTGLRYSYSCLKIEDFIGQYYLKEKLCRFFLIIVFYVEENVKMGLAFMNCASVPAMIFRSAVAAGKETGMDGVPFMRRKLYNCARIKEFLFLNEIRTDFCRVHFNRDYFRLGQY